MRYRYHVTVTGGHASGKTSVIRHIQMVRYIWSQKVVHLTVTDCFATVYSHQSQMYNAFDSRRSRIAEVPSS
jgi:uridine kinase